MQYSFLSRILTFCFCFLVLVTCHQAAANPLQIKITRGPHSQIINLDEFDDFPFASGDLLTIYPKGAEKNLLTTPDGNKHVLTSTGKAIRIPKK